MIRNKEYWIARALQRENEAYLRGVELTAKMFQEYDRAAKAIRRDIGDFYSKYAGKYGLTYDQAVRLLTRKEFQEWKATLGEYITRIAAEPDPRVKALLTAQLDALSTNSRISRLEALLGQIDLKLNELWETGVSQMKAEFGETFREGYYKKVYDIQSRAGFIHEFAKLDESVVENVLSYTKVKKNKKAARASAGKSIEKRDPEIDTREEVGHWEMDCVEGKKKTKETLLVLSERKARKEIMIKMKDQTAGSVVAALDRLERRYGTLFYKIFQTITVDNGSEFADVEGLERSCRRKGKRTTVFYCHPYSSYERGTNENINRMIRRWFPKGTDFGQVPKKAIQAVEDWLNAYPREILGFRSADEVFAEGLAALG